MRWIKYIPLLIFFSCEPGLVEPYEVFTIKEGSHSSGLKLEQLQSTVVRFSAIFDESAIYQTLSEVNQHDINKLIGFSDCNAHHHESSARFGWRWLDDQLEIHTYTYLNGERYSEYIGTIELNKAYDFTLSLGKERYRFEVSGYDPVEVKRESKCNYGVYYKLFPYFGGNEVAPHDINIKIKFQY